MLPTNDLSIGQMVEVDGEPGYFVTWFSKHVVFVQKGGQEIKVERYRVE